MAKGELIFVYNVDATPTALLRDLYLSVTTGATDCHLCDLTFGKVVKDPEWAAFVRSLPLPVTFHMRSTVVRRYPETEGHTFPAAFLKLDDQPLVEVISATEMNAAETLDDLRTVVADCVASLPEASTTKSPAPATSS